jgi:hypothetical protein
MPDYFTIAELRARYSELDDVAYPDAAVDDVAATAEQAIEDACNVAFVPRVATDVVSTQTPYGERRLLNPPVRSIDSAVDASANSIDVTGAVVDGRWVALPDGWPSGQVSITYTHGHTEPPLRVKQAAMVLTREWLISGPVTDRQTQLPTEAGGAVNLAVPGGRFGTFGIPEVDAAVAAYTRESLVA